MMAKGWVNMVYFKVRFAISFFKRERTELAFPIVQFSKQNPNPGGYSLVGTDRARRYS